MYNTYVNSQKILSRHSNIDSTYEDGTFKIFRKYEVTNNTSSSVLKKDNDDRKKTSKVEFKDRNEVNPY